MADRVSKRSDYPDETIGAAWPLFGPAGQYRSWALWFASAMPAAVTATAAAAAHILQLRLGYTRYVSLVVPPR